MNAIDPSQHNVWALGCIKACQLSCLMVLLLILNDFIKRALGKDYNKADGLEVRHLKYKLLNSYKKQDLIRSLLVEVCSVQTTVLQRQLSPPTENKHNAYLDQHQIPFFRSYDWRDTRKQLYYPQNVWFYGCEKPFAAGTGTSSTASTEEDEQYFSNNSPSEDEKHSHDEFISGDHFSSDEDWDYFSTSSSDYPNSDADESHYHEAMKSCQVE